MSVAGRVALKSKHRSALRVDARSTTTATVVPRPILRTGAYQPLVIVLGAMCAGIFLDRMAWPLLPQSFGLWLALGVVSLGTWLVLWKLQYAQLSMAAVMLSVMAIGGALHHYQWNLFGANDVGLAATNIGEPICIEAIVATEPQEVPVPAFDPMRALPQELQTRLLVDVVSVRNGAEWQSASGRAQVSLTGALNEAHVGDRLQMFGQIEAPAPAGNPGEFDSSQFDRSKRELSFIRIKQPGCAKLVEAGSNWSPARWISQVRAAGTRLLQDYLPQARSGMAAAVLLGERQEVDRETNEAFLETGTIHILVIAGLHIGILAWAMFLLFSAGWMPRRAALACVMLVTGFYMLLTSAEPPVVRATLLVWIVCGGMLLGRNRIGLNSLALAAIVVLIVNPTGLFHTGVQLSFLSVAVLVCAGQWLTNLWQRDALARLISTTRPWPQRTARHAGRHVVEVFLAGALLWIAITPLTMARFHLFTPSGMVLNVLLLPILPVVMLSGLGVLVFGAWLTPVAALCAAICNFGLYVIDGAVKWFAHLPGGRFWVVGPSKAWLVVFYAGLLIVLLAPRWLPPVRWRIALLAGLCGVGLVSTLPVWASANRPLRCEFIAVGHGGGELMELPDGRTLLYDAGRMGAPFGGARSISAFLWSRGITHLDAVVISHADTDHYNSLPELLERFSVGVVYESPVMYEQKSKALNVLRTSIEESGTSIRPIYAGDRLKAGEGVTIDVLHPPPQGVVGTDNANCVVLLVEYCGRRILLTGDLATPGIELVMNGDPMKCDVLQLPHHGSSYSAPENFSNWTKPQFGIICGSDTDGRIAGRVYEAHGTKVLNTAECGAVTVTIDGGAMNVETFRQPDANLATDGN